MRLSDTASDAELKCAECNNNFEISKGIAEAMHRWRAASGEPFLCRECADIDEIRPAIQEDSKSYVPLFNK